MADGKPPLKLPGLPEKPENALLRAARKAAEKPIVDRVIDHLVEFWGDERACPYCGRHQWNIDPEAVGLPRYEGSGVIPAYMVTCTTCGQTTFLLAEAIGIEPDDS